MKAFQSQTPIFIEFKETSVHVLDQDEGLVAPVERQANGALTAASSELLANTLRGFLHRHGGGSTRTALCSIPARGVSLRRIGLPASAKEDITRLLTMQIEAQFPISPGELAWGYEKVRNTISGGNGAVALQQFLVGAVRKEMVDDYGRLLESIGLAPSFTIGALARCWANGTATPCNALDIGKSKSELLLQNSPGSQDHEAPSLRTILWGADQITDVGGLDGLHRSIQTGGIGKIYLSGEHGPLRQIATGLSARLGPGVECQVVESAAELGRTAANIGLKRLIENGGAPLLLGVREHAAEKAAAPPTWKWAVAAGVLLLIALSVRYAEGLLFNSAVSKKIAEIRAFRSSLPAIDREVGFLQYIKTNQPPYLDTVAVLAKTAPPGTKFEALSILRRGEVTFKGAVNNPQAPEDFRSKLIDSGFFSKVVVEEQSPHAQDRQKINFRISAQLKNEESRKPLPPEPPLTNNPAAVPGSSRPGSPPGFPPGFPGPMPMPMPMPGPPQQFRPN